MKSKSVLLWCKKGTKTMKTKLISLLLLIATLTVMLASCGTFNFEKKDMNISRGASRVFLKRSPRPGDNGVV